MPYINVDEAYILDNTGLQVDQVADIPYTDAALTDTQKAQARKNIAAGGTNPNLLDNPFWTVNQRNTSAVTTDGTYCADRWFLYSNAVSSSVTQGASGLQFTSTNGNSGYVRIRQKLADDIFRRLLGASLTLSIMLDGEVYSVTGSIPSTVPTAQTSIIPDTTVTTNNGIVLLGLIWQPTISQGSAIIRVYNTQLANSVKLELGTVSTLANDTPTNYAEELDRCQYYFERIAPDSSNLGIGVGIGNGSSLYVPIRIHPKAKFPTLTYSGGIGIGQSAYATDITSFSISASSMGACIKSGNFQLSAGVSHTAGEAYRLILKTGSYIDFSADL